MSTCIGKWLNGEIVSKKPETEFIDSFLHNTNPSKDLSALLTAFQEKEQQILGPSVHKLPYLLWQEHLSETQKNTLLKRLDETAADSTGAAAAVRSLAIRLGILMRLQRNKTPLMDIFVEELKSLDFRETSAELLLECGNILYALANFPLLEWFCDRALVQTDPESENMSVFADWMVISRYRQLLRLFERNELGRSELEQFNQLVAKTESRMKSGSKNAMLYRALADNLKGDLDAAIALTLEAQTTEGKLLDKFQQFDNIRHPDSLTFEASHQVATLAKNVAHSFRHDARLDDVTLLVSCDENYFKQFSAKLLESFAYWNPDGLVHLHLVNFKPPMSVIESIEQRYGLRVNVSVDTRPAVIDDPALLAGYCAGARYIFLPFYLAHYSRIVVADMDGLIRCKLTDVWRNHDDSIVMTSKLLQPHWTSVRVLWEAIAAGSFGIANNPNNLAFAWGCANYVADMYVSCSRNNRELFFTDQIGLFLAYWRMKKTCKFEPMMGLFSQGTNLAYSAGGTVKQEFQHSVDYKVVKKLPKRHKPT